MKTSKLSMAIALILSGAMASGAAFAAKGGIAGKPGGGEETAAQNLSVPAIMVGAAPGGLVCDGDAPETASPLLRPLGEPLTGYEVPGYYYVQKVHTWRAQCFNDVGADVFGAWGDNLEGDAKLKVGSPIRVELVLMNSRTYGDGTTSLLGYPVIKLEPSQLDRNSAYGHAANAPTAVSDTPAEFGQGSWLVHDNQITFSVQNLDTDVYAVPPGTNPTAEINATGKIVYGYNLRVSEAGNYRITFTSSTGVVFTGVDAGGQVDDNNVYIDINVTQSGGGGGGGGGKPPKSK